MTINLLDFKKAKVLVIGDIMLDRYWYGISNRISPEAPVPIINIKKIEEKLGGAANVAMNIKKLGAKSILTGIVGIDDASNIIYNTLNKENIKCNLVNLENYPTTTKLRIISHDQQLLRIDFEKIKKKLNIHKKIEKKIDLALKETNTIVLSDYNKGVLHQAERFIKKARAANMHILVDPKGNDFNKYIGSTILTPNIDEFEAAVGKCCSKKQLVKQGMQLIKDLKLSALLITQSENGMTLLQYGKKSLHYPSQAKKVFDVTGAGDTVISVLAASLSIGRSLETSCLIANIAAGISVGKFGTSTVSKKEIENNLFNLKKNNYFDHINENKLKFLVKKAKMKGEKIVMINECFNILNTGHISYLNNIKKLGDRLIVAISSNFSLKNLKDKNHDSDSLKNKIKIIQSLRLVDWIIEFNESTPLRLI